MMVCCIPHSSFYTPYFLKKKLKYKYEITHITSFSFTQPTQTLDPSPNLHLSLKVIHILKSPSDFPSIQTPKIKKRKRKMNRQHVWVSPFFFSPKFEEEYGFRCLDKEKIKWKVEETEGEKRRRN